MSSVNVSAAKAAVVATADAASTAMIECENFIRVSPYSAPVPSSTGDPRKENSRIAAKFQPALPLLEF